MAAAPRNTEGLAEALAELPLFPLPQAVLFPGAMLPLHVFEPRYRAMVREVLDTHRCLAVVLITDARAVDSHGHPRIASVAGAGQIVDAAELPGGRFNIVVQGRARVRLVELPYVPPFRRARATLLGDATGEAEGSALAALVSSATAFAAVIRERDPSFEFKLPKEASASQVADLCAHHLVLDARERQNILETLDLGERLRMTTEALAIQRLTLSAERRDVN